MFLVSYETRNKIKTNSKGDQGTLAIASGVYDFLQGCKELHNIR